ncbi:hypothetical protein bcgnr5384_09640 [Bacillus cereus]
MVTYMKFKCKLKIILAELDIKQSNFAKRFGVDDTTLSAIVRNCTKPRFDILHHSRIVYFET